MADIGIKPEIKVDPTDGQSRLADVEEFEEDTDLQFPPKETQSWFARVPNDLWAAWHKLYEDAEDDAQIEIGKMRVYNANKDTVDIRDQRIEIKLQKGIPGTTSLPQKYTLKIQTLAYNNSVVFSEKDLPGHSSRSFGRNRFVNSNKPTGINKNDRYGKKGYSSAIPKQTALAPKIEHEATVSAQINPEDFFQSAAAAIPQSSFTSIQFEHDNRNLMPARTAGVFSSFTSGSRPGKDKKKKPKEKFVRMDQQQLYDAIYRCFGQYKYWRLGAFRRELRQPETYIKSTLDTVANLVRSGDFAGCWVLKPEYAQMLKIDQSQVKEESAVVDSAGEDATDGGTGDELDDDDDIGDLEDVKMEDSRQ